MYEMYMCTCTGETLALIIYDHFPKSTINPLPYYDHQNLDQHSNSNSSNPSQSRTGTTAWKIPRTHSSDRLSTRTSDHVFVNVPVSNFQSLVELGPPETTWRQLFWPHQKLGLQTISINSQRHNRLTSLLLFFPQSPITPPSPEKITTSPVNKIIRKPPKPNFWSNQNCTFILKLKIMILVLEIMFLYKVSVYSLVLMN